MSGPKTFDYSFSAARREELARRQAEDRRRREELAARVAAAKRKCSELEKMAGRLSRAVGELRECFPAERIEVAVPNITAPPGDDAEALEAFHIRMEAALRRSENDLQLAGQQAKANRDFRAATGRAAELVVGTVSTATEAMKRYAEYIAIKIGDSAQNSRRQEIDRILGRFGTDNWRHASSQLEGLVMEALSAANESRFSALTTEIRHQLQQAAERDIQRKEDAAKARGLLEKLEIGVPIGAEQVKQRLELVKVGAIALSQDIESAAEYVLARAADEEEAFMHDLAAQTVSETLSDLGYDVSPIEETLFAKGGKVYFRKAGWRNYCVRLTVRPEESRMNFNVVRIDGEGSSSRSADIEAENAWCSGYSELVNTFAARGLSTQLTRHLPVGALPVQTVGKDEVSESSFRSNRGDSRKDSLGTLGKRDGRK